MNAARAIVIECVEIPESMIAQEAQNHPSDNPGAAWREAGRALAVKALLLHRATELGLEPEQQTDESGLLETIDEALIRAVLDAEVEIASPTEDECRRVYDTQRARFTTPPLYEASHILIEPEGESAVEIDGARSVAENLIGQLSKDPASFADLARGFSACSSAQTRGSLGQLRTGDLVPEVEHALLALEPGAISAAPVRSRYGWHVLRLDRRIDGRELPFAFVAEQIKLHLESRAWMAAAARYTANLAEALRERSMTLSYLPQGEITEGSLALGDFLSEEAAARVAPWLAASDPKLASAIDAAANAAGTDVATLVRRGVHEFVDHADDEAWTQLISAAQRADDPALAAIATIMKSKLAPKRPSVTLIKTA